MDTGRHIGYKAVFVLTFTLGVIFSDADVVAAHRSTGFEASGYLMYISEAGGERRSCVVRLFQFQSISNAWKVRTESADNQAFPGRLEVSGNEREVNSLTIWTNDSSNFRELREELIRTKASEVFFRPPQRTDPPLVLSTRRTENSRAESDIREVSVSPSPNVPISDNSGVAQLTGGAYPIQDSSFTAFIWFAFTAPRTLEAGLLLQLWDEGNSQDETYFREATWDRFPEYPGLISEATFTFRGKKRTKIGHITKLGYPPTGFGDASQIAATYKVNQKTNVDGMCIPINLRFTRFVASSQPLRQTLSTIDCFVTSVRTIESGGIDPFVIPSKTVVRDHRASQEIGGEPVRYLQLDSGPPMETALLEKSPIYKTAQRQYQQRQKHPSKSISNTGVVLIGFMVVNIGLICLWKKMAANNHNNIK